MVLMEGQALYEVLHVKLRIHRSVLTCYIVQCTIMIQTYVVDHPSSPAIELSFDHNRHSKPKSDATFLINSTKRPRLMQALLGGMRPLLARRKLLSR